MKDREQDMQKIDPRIQSLMTPKIQSLLAELAELREQQKKVDKKGRSRIPVLGEDLGLLLDRLGNRPVGWGYNIRL